MIRVFSGGPQSATGNDRYPVELLETTYNNQLASFKAGNIHTATCNEISRQVEATSEAAYAYHVNGNPIYLAEVTKRLDLLAQPIVERGCRKYPVNGTARSIGYTNYYRREYVWCFGLAYDFAQQGLSDEYKKKIVQVSGASVGVAADTTLAKKTMSSNFPQTSRCSRCRLNRREVHSETAQSCFAPKSGHAFCALFSAVQPRPRRADGSRTLT